MIGLFLVCAAFFNLKSSLMRQSAAHVISLVWLLVVGHLVMAADEPTFAQDIAPLIYQHCAPCHQPSGIGPFSLLSYENARKHGRQIAEVTASGFMPPWKPSADCSAPLRDVRALTAEQIDIFQQWYHQGFPPGDLTQAPPPPDYSTGWLLGKPDLVLELPEPYLLAAQGKDVYRVFVLPIPITEKRYVRAVEFLPETRLVLHHAVFALDSTPASRRRDDAAPGPGFDSMDLGQAINPNGHIIGWTPGQVPYEVFPGTAWEVNPGTDLLLQLHLLPGGKPTPVSPKVGFYFSVTPPTRTSTVIQLRANAIDIPAGATAYTVQERFTLPVAAQVLGLYPHAHYLGRDLQTYAELPDGTKQWLLRIPDWDFNWQSDYRLVEPLSLPAGTRIVMHYVYDNSAANPRNPSFPPKRVIAGWSSLDEMGEVAIQLLLNQPADRLKMDESQARYDLSSGAAAASSWYNLALALDYQGHSREAIPAYEQAITLDPHQAQALNNLAVIFEKRGEIARATDLYRRSAAADPAQAEARFNLSKILDQQGSHVEARELLTEILTQQPSHFRARAFLADLLMAAHQPSAAVEILESGRSWHQDNPVYQLQLGKIYAVQGDHGTARTHLVVATTLPVLTDGFPNPSETSQVQCQAYYTLALLARQTGDGAGLVKALEATLRIQPHHVDALLLSAVVIFAKNQNQLARPYLDTLARLPPEQIPETTVLLQSLPFPEGAIVLIEAFQEAGLTRQAQEAISQCLAFARQQQRVDWIVRLESVVAVRVKP